MDAASMAAASTTDRTTPQHLQALERANRVRLARAALKREIASGGVSAADVVRDCPWETETMPLSELLASQRRWGRTRVRKFLQTVSLSEQKRLGSLTSRQRVVLTDHLEAKQTGRHLDEMLVA